jgi:hypothetical protein
VLARFDHSGNCRSVFPSVETILGRLRAAELNYPETGPAWRSRMDWSRRTVFVYLKRLERAGIATSGGLSSYHGTKRRELHSERLLSVPLESCTPTPRESCTRSKSLDSKKLQRSRRKQNHPADDVARASRSELNPNVNGRPARVGSVNGKTDPATVYAVRLTRFTATARKNILARTTESPDTVDVLLQAVVTRAADARTVIHSAAYLERGFDSQLADDAAALECYEAAPDLLKAAPDLRRKIAFVQRCVEDAARSGRRASEVLAERLAP